MRISEIGSMNGATTRTAREEFPAIEEFFSQDSNKVIARRN